MSIRIQSEEPKNYSGLELLKSEHIETVFKVVPPLKGLEDGFGFIGVLLRNKKEDTIQCHICGKWFRNLGLHTIQVHKISAKEYKYKFSLPLSFPMCSRHMSRQLSISGSKQIKNLKAGGKLAWTYRTKRSFRHQWNNLAFLNQIGSCPEQINRRYLIVTDEIGHEPSYNELVKYDVHLVTKIVSRFGSFNKFRKANGYKVVHKNRWLNDSKLIAKLRNFARVYGRLPKQMDFRTGTPSSTAYINHFGSWNRALNIAGLLR